MAKHLTGIACAALALSVAGCGMMPESKKIDYKSAGKAPTLEIPPDLSQITRDDRFSVPDSAGKGTATFSAYSADRTQTSLQQNPLILPQVEKIRVERSGSQRWLVVAMPADQLWDTLKDFWQETGFIIKLEMPQAGIMETDWAENRANIPADFLRSSLGKLIDVFYSSAERDKFRTRLEPGATTGTTDIFISHRGMEEVYTSRTKEETRWQPRQADPELEAEMLRRLMVRLGTEEKRAEQALASVKTEPRAHLGKMADGAAQVEVQEKFDRAWRRVGLALDRVGFTVEDRDRTKGLYFVRYVDPEVDNKKDDKGWLSKISLWKKEEAQQDRVSFRIYVKESGSQTRVQVLSAEGGVDQSETAKKILNLLYEQLR